MTDQLVATAKKSFCEKLSSQFELDADVVDTIGDLCASVVRTAVESCATTTTASGGDATEPAKEAKAKTPRKPRAKKGAAAAEATTAVAAPAAKAAAAEKKPRKVSAYNVFIRESMKDPQVTSKNPTERMGAIASTWKDLPAGEKQRYKVMADEENANNAAKQQEASMSA